MQWIGLMELCMANLVWLQNNTRKSYCNTPISADPFGGGV